MKVTGFTFIRNAVKYDYPIVEAIKSILPVCDEVVVAVGKSVDDTIGLIECIDPDKIKIIKTEWEEDNREGGRILAIETDKALTHISADTDWCFYIQGDEVVHEKYLETIRVAMKRYLQESTVDGLLFKYLHFYGSYDYVGASSNWYRREIRVVRNNRQVYSYKDAQGFRKGNNEKLRVVLIDAYIYHYGWVKEPKAMQRKQKDFYSSWYSDIWKDRVVKPVEAFDYAEQVTRLTRFIGEHPKVMQERVRLKNWQFEYDLSIDRRTVKDRAKYFIRRNFGWEIGYKNYKIIQPKGVQ